MDPFGGDMFGGAISNMMSNFGNFGSIQREF